VGDIGVEAVSDRGLLFLSFVSMLGELCVEVLARGSPVIWRGSFSLLFLVLVFVGADGEECIIAVSVVLGRFSNQSWLVFSDVMCIRGGCIGKVVSALSLHFSGVFSGCSKGLRSCVVCMFMSFKRSFLHVLDV